MNNLIYCATIVYFTSTQFFPAIVHDVQDKAPLGMLGLLIGDQHGTQNLNTWRER